MKNWSISSFRLIAACEFLYGTKKQAEEMGSSWLEEIKEEFLFAVLCQGDTKVTLQFISEVKLSATSS